nr:Uma2 family endonuclease [Halomicronema hongdechloris]
MIGCRDFELTWEALQERKAVIRLNEPPPLLMIEVVSESTKSTDYRAKRAEYSVLDIPEYWICDPLNSGWCGIRRKNS